MLSAADRLFDTQPLLDQLADIDVTASLRALRLDMLCDMGTLLRVSAVIIDAGHHDVLAAVRREVADRLPAGALITDAAFHAAAAAAFADVLDDSDRVALSLPWALCATTEQ